MSNYSKIWTQSGALIVDTAGRPIVCDVCPCPDDCETLLARLSAISLQYQGTRYGEGVLVQRREAGDTTIIAQAAYLYNTGTADRIAMVLCGEGDECRWADLEYNLATDGYYEAPGACACPDVALLRVETVASGGVWHGPALLVDPLSTTNIGWNYRRYMAVAEIGPDIVYIECNCGGRGSEPRAVFPGAILPWPTACGCVDMRQVIMAYGSAIPGVLDWQMGSHSCFTTTDSLDMAGNPRRYVVWYGETEFSMGGGYIDYDALVIRVRAQDGKYYIVMLSSTSAGRKITPGWNTPGRAAAWGPYDDAVLSGYAHLFRHYNSPTLSGWAMDTIPGDTITADVYPAAGADAVRDYPLGEDPAGALAAAEAWAAETVPFSLHTAEFYCNHFQTEVEDQFIHPPTCDYLSIPPTAGKVTLVEWPGEGFPFPPYYHAVKKLYTGRTWIFRMIMTNRGVLLPDGTLHRTFSVPSAEDARACCGNHSIYSYEADWWRGGPVELGPDEGIIDPPPVCDEEEPEELL